MPASTRFRSRMSPMSGTMLMLGNFSRISRSSSNRGLSAISNITSFAGNSFPTCRQNPEPGGRFLAVLDDVAHLGGGCRGDGDDDLVDFVVAANRADLLVAPQNPQSLDPASDLGLVIVDEPHIDHPEGRIVMDFPGDHLPRGARPHDQHPAGEFAATATERLSPHTHEVARSENRKEGDPPVEKIDRPRDRYVREKEKIASNEIGGPRGATPS